MSARRDQQVAEIRAALAALVEPGGVVELRALNCGRQGTIAGYFDDLDAMAKEAARIDNMTPAPTGIYAIVDQIPRALLSRAANKVKTNVRDALTADADIKRRRWLKIDADPQRAKGISATDDEHAAALERAERVRAWLAGCGWPDPLVGDSGNGAHLLYRVDLPNDDASKDLVKRCLLALAAMFDDELVKIDTGVYNAARIWKLYATTARKGDDTDERPHRRAQLLNVPEQPQVVADHLLRSLADQAPGGKVGAKAAKSNTQPARDFWRAETPDEVESWAQSHGLHLGVRRSNGDGYKWSVDCLTSNEHADGAALLLNGDGFLNYKCQHASCQSRRAADIFRKYPPPAAIAHRNGHTRYEHAYTTDMPEGLDDAAEPARRDRVGRMIIDPRGQLRDVRNEALKAIVYANEQAPAQPVLLVRGGALVRLRHNDKGNIVAEPVNSGALLNILAEVADWEIESDDEKDPAPTKPPKEIVPMLLNAREWPGLPVLDGITYAPTFTSGGRLHAAPGYDADTRLYNGGSVQLGDTTPTPENVRAALSLFFDDLVVDFPFVDDASKAHALALYLLPFGRRMITGPTPFHVVNATARGTGKSKLVETCLYAALDKEANADTYPIDPNELRKKITTKVAQGASYLFLDNLAGKVDSADLAAALTQQAWSDRALGSNTSIEGSIDWLWVATGNSVNLSPDIARRTVMIKLDAGMEHPDTRSGFKHNLEQWRAAHRADLVTAAITLWRNWLENAGGRRWKGRAKGSFENWAEVMGGVLDAAGVTGFLANDDAMRQESDRETADYRAFVTAWAERHDTGTVTAKTLMLLASSVYVEVTDENYRRTTTREGDDILAAHLGAGNERSRLTMLGNILKDINGRIFGQWRVTLVGEDPRTKSKLWQLCEVHPPRERTAVHDSVEPARNLAEPSRNLESQRFRENSVLSTSGVLSFREESAEPAEPFPRSGNNGEKTPSDDACVDVHTPVYIESGEKVPQVPRTLRENMHFPLVDSARNLGGQRFRGGSAEVPQIALDAYLGRDLTPTELGAAVQAANTIGADFRQLPAGGGMWRVIVDKMPELQAGD